MKENTGYDFFTNASRLILFVPLLLFIYLILIKWGGSAPLVMPESGKVAKGRVASPSPSQSSLNLTGPFVCETKLEAGTMSAFIKDRMVVATFSAKSTVSHVLVKGDCAYLWEGEKPAEGRKICGLGGILPLADSFLSTGFLTPESLFSSIGITGQSAAGVDSQAILSSCKKNTIPERILFEVPRGVQFTEKKE